MKSLLKEITSRTGCPAIIDPYLLVVLMLSSCLRSEECGRPKKSSCVCAFRGAI